jgi:hypothetical protein
VFLITADEDVAETPDEIAVGARRIDVNDGIPAGKDQFASDWGY